MNLIERKIIQHMVKAILERVFTHWKTTSAGVATSAVVLSVMLGTYQSGMTWKQWLLAAIPALVGALLKDNLGAKPAAPALLLLLMPGLLCAQTPQTPAVNTFTANLTAISLPGGQQTAAGTLSGVSLGITQNLSVHQVNLIAPGNVSGFYGGASYNIAPFSKFLNNLSPQLNGYQFRLSLDGSIGVDRITTGSNTVQHWSGLAGGTLSYAIAGSKTWNLAVSVSAARIPGYAKGWVPVVALGPSIHF